MTISEIIEQPHPVLDKILKNCEKQIENSKWHVSQPLSDHLLKTKQEVKKIINSLGIKYLDYLDQIVDQNSKKDLLILVGLLHDIGKDVKGIRSEMDEIYDPLKKGIKLKKTSYIGHEKAGGIAVISILEEIGFSKKEVEYVSQFIANHDYVHQAADAIFNGANRSESIQICKKQVDSLYPELLLQSLADMRSGTLDLVDKTEFSFKEILLLELIQEQEQFGFTI